jgi:hypothetical protein
MVVNLDIELNSPTNQFSREIELTRQLAAGAH